MALADTGFTFTNTSNLSASFYANNCSIKTYRGGRQRTWRSSSTRLRHTWTRGSWLGNVRRCRGPPLASRTALPWCSRRWQSGWSSRRCRSRMQWCPCRSQRCPAGGTRSGCSGPSTGRRCAWKQWVTGQTNKSSMNSFLFGGEGMKIRHNWNDIATSGLLHSS